MGPAVRVPNRRILPLQGQISAAVTSNAAISTVQPPVTSCQLGTAKIFDTPFTSSQPLSQSLTPITGRVRPISSSVTVVNTLSINGSMSQQPSEQHNTTSSSHTRVISSPTPDLGTTPSSASCFSSAPSSCTFSRSVSQLSSPAAVFHARFGRTSKYATKDSPRMFGVRCVVDFERIYRYLSVIHKPNEECHLTPMGKSQECWSLVKRKHPVLVCCLPTTQVRKILTGASLFFLVETANEQSKRYGRIRS